MCMNCSRRGSSDAGKSLTANDDTPSPRCAVQVMVLSVGLAALQALVPSYPVRSWVLVAVAQSVAAAVAVAVEAAGGGASASNSKTKDRPQKIRATKAYYADCCVAMNVSDCGCASYVTKW